MPPSFRGGLLCAMAAVAATSSTEAITPERTCFIKASLEAAFVCGLYTCRDHAGRRGPRQGAQSSAGGRFSAKRNDCPSVFQFGGFILRDAGKSYLSSLRGA